MTGFYETLKNITIVLVKPKYPENIGAAARVAHNMGLENIIVVSAQEMDTEKIKRVATHNAGHILEKIGFSDDLDTVLADFCLAVGTTARHGRARQIPVLPTDLYAKIRPYLKKNKVAIVFGPESRGLDNSELKNCQMSTSIPTCEFSSLNLGQAVAVICYELHRGMLAGQQLPGKEALFAPRLASIAEQDDMYENLRGLLTKVDMLAGKKRPENRLKKIYNILTRRDLMAKETRLISELCRQLEQVMPAVHTVD